MGADYVLDTSKEDLTKRVMGLTSGERADKVFECVGGNQVETFKQPIELVGTTGRFVNIGNYTNEPRNLILDTFYHTWWQKIEREEIEVTGSRGSNS